MTQRSTDVARLAALFDEAVRAHARAALRGTLRQRIAASPLCDGPRFAMAFASALRELWRAWCSQT